MTKIKQADFNSQPVLFIIIISYYSFMTENTPLPVVLFPIPIVPSMKLEVVKNFPANE
jgi:hypothetical protein